MHSLLQLLTQKRRQSFSLPTPISYFLPLDDTHNELVLPNKTAVESGPFFPRLKKFTVTADVSIEIYNLRLQIKIVNLVSNLFVY